MINPTDPAFPKLPLNQGDQGISYPGLSKREYFAALAMQGLRAAALSDQITGTEPGRKLWSSKGIAEQAVWDADALIGELSK